MPLLLRLAAADEYPAIEQLVIDSFEPITWQKKLDARFGPLNGRDWRQRWRDRLRHVFETQIVLVGEDGGVLSSVATATVDRKSALAFIDILAVGRPFQWRGLGRDMLLGTIEHLRGQGCQYVHLDCLTDNDTANTLYQSEGFEEVARHIRWFKKL
jgi:GNAT superfamily N-acetyltransferase